MDGKTPEGTGQAEDYRLRLSPRKAKPSIQVIQHQKRSKTVSLKTILERLN